MTDVDVLESVLDDNLDSDLDDDEGHVGLDAELRRLGGPGARGTAMSLTRYWPVTACGLAVPESLAGSAAAQACLVGGLAALGLMAYADRLVRSGRSLPARLTRLFSRT